MGKRPVKGLLLGPEEKDSNGGIIAGIAVVLFIIAVIAFS